MWVATPWLAMAVLEAFRTRWSLGARSCAGGMSSLLWLPKVYYSTPFPLLYALSVHCLVHEVGFGWGKNKDGGKNGGVPWLAWSVWEMDGQWW